MDYAHFLAICRDIYLGAGGVDLVIFGRHKHDNEDLYVLDGWLRLYDMMELLHEKILEGE